MDKTIKTDNLNSNRILLAGIIVFLVTPISLYLLDKTTNDIDLFNPKLLIGIVFVTALLVDKAYVKLHKKNQSKNDKNT